MFLLFHIKMFVGTQLSTYKTNAVRKRVMYMEYVWIHLYIENIDIIYIDIQKKRDSYKNFDSKITTFLLKLLAISFFAYEQSHTYIKSTWFQTHLTKERTFQFTILFFVWNREQTLNFLVRRKYRWRGIFVFLVNVGISMLFWRKEMKEGVIIQTYCHYYCINLHSQSFFGESSFTYSI